MLKGLYDHQPYEVNALWELQFTQTSAYSNTNAFGSCCAVVCDSGHGAMVEVMAETFGTTLLAMLQALAHDVPLLHTVYLHAM